MGEFNPERISLLKKLGTRNLLHLSEHGIGRELHLSLFDEFDREMVYKVLGSDQWSEANKFRISQAIGQLAKEINDANYPGTNVVTYIENDREGG